MYQEKMRPVSARCLQGAALLVLLTFSTLAAAKDPRSCLDLAKQQNATSYVEAVMAAKLDSVMGDPTFGATCLVPTNAAFAKVGRLTADETLEVLLYHMLPSDLMTPAAMVGASPIDTLLKDQNVTVTGSPAAANKTTYIIRGTTNTARILLPGVQSDYAMVYMIDTVLIPEFSGSSQSSLRAKGGVKRLSPKPSVKASPKPGVKPAASPSPKPGSKLSPVPSPKPNPIPSPKPGPKPGPKPQPTPSPMKKPEKTDKPYKAHPPAPCEPSKPSKKPRKEHPPAPCTPEEPCAPDHHVTRKQHCSTVWEIINTMPDTSHFAALVKAAGLQSFMSDPSFRFTAFVPVNEAVVAFAESKGLRWKDLKLDTVHLLNYVRYHIVPGMVLTNAQILSFANFPPISTLLGREWKLTLGLNPSTNTMSVQAALSKAWVIPEACDVQACGGSVVHFITRFLVSDYVCDSPPPPCSLPPPPCSLPPPPTCNFPPPPCGTPPPPCGTPPPPACDAPPPPCTTSCTTPYLTLQNRGDMYMFLTALERTGMAQWLHDPTKIFTVFAPTDQAIQAYIAQGGAWLNDPELFSLVTYHLVGERAYTADQLLSMSAVKTIPKKYLVFVKMFTSATVTVFAERSSAAISTPNIVACNSIIHVITGPLLLNKAQGPAPVPTPWPVPTPAPVPAPVPATGPFASIYQALQSIPELSNIKSLVDVAAITNSYVNGTVIATLFFPSNAAFARLASVRPDMHISYLVANPVLAGRIVNYHTISNFALQSSVLFADTPYATAYNNRPIVMRRLLSGALMVQDELGSVATVVNANNQAGRAIIHIVDNVLLTAF